MHTTSIKCDSCSKELCIDSPHPANYGLTLSCQNFGYNTSAMQYAVHMFPLLERDLHFCGFDCLTKWLSRKSNPTPGPVLGKLR